MTNEQKKDYALLIYTAEPTATQKEIAQRVGVSEQSMSKWAKEGAWDKMRRSRLATRQAELNNAYLQLEELNRNIMSRPEGERVPSSKEADVQVKLASQIRSLETQTSAADVMDVGMAFIEFVRQIAPEKSAEVLALYDGFMKQVIQRA